MMSMSRPGKRALALVASISLSRLYVRSGIGLYHLRAPIPSRWAPTCRDRLIDYRSLFPAMKARRLAATTMAVPCGRTEPRLLVGVQSHSPDGRKRTIALARHVRSEPCTFAVEHRLQPCRLGCRGAIQPEILHSERPHRQRHQATAGDRELRQIEQSKVVSVLLVSGDPLIIRDEVATAVENEPAPIDLDRQWVV